MHLSFKKYLAIILITFSLVALPAFSQSPDWLNYTNGKNVTSLATEGNFLWIGTVRGGLVKMNRTTFAMNFYNKTNSSLPTNTIISLGVDTSGNKWIGTYQGLIKYTGTAWSVYNSLNSGLPSDTVTNIAFDINGVKWMTTPNSVVKFDNLNWTVYNISNSPIHSNQIFTVALDPSNNVWIGGNNGVDVFNGTTWKWYAPFNSGVPDLLITSIAFKSNGQAVVGTKQKGFALKNATDTVWTTFNTSNSVLTSNQIIDIAVDASNVIYLGTPNGLTKFGSTWSTFTSSNSLIPDNLINSVVADVAGNVWVGTPDSLGRLAGTIWTIFNPSSYAIPENNLRTIAQDLDGMKWISTYHSGVFKFDATNWTAFKYSANGLASNNVSFIGVDASNNKWFCTDSGVSKFDGTTWLTYKRSNSGLPSDTVTCIAFEGNTIWVGTAGFGVAKFNGTTWTKYNSTNSNLPDDNVLSILVDKFGNKWIGTSSKGVAKFNGTDWTIFDNNNTPLPNATVKAIILEGQNKKWFVTGRGVAMYNDTVWVTYTTSNSAIPDDNISYMVIEQNGLKWFTSPTSGLIRFDGTTWTSFSKSGSPVPENKMDWLIIDASGNKWIVTDGGGLLVYRLTGILPTVATSAVAGPFCVDAQVSVSFTAFGSANFVNFGATNVFTAQLSDPTGNFATPVNIGILTSQTSGNIIGRLPKTLAYGTGYRIRVVASSPSIINYDDGKDFTIFVLPKPSITGSLGECAGGVTRYKTTAVPGIAFAWSVLGGTVTGTSSDSLVTIIWGQKGTGTIKLIQTTPAGCKDSVSVNVQISSKPPKIIYGDTTVCGDRYTVYTTVADTSLKNEWFAVGGTVTDRPEMNNVRVLWGGPGLASIKLVQTNSSGCKDSITMTVHKLLSPNTFFNGLDTVKYRTTKIYQSPAPAAGINNKWYVTGGKINGSNTGNTLSVTWGDGKIGSVKLVQSTASGCKDSMEKTVFIYEPVLVNGNRIVCENLTEDYYSVSNLESDCKWEVTGGTITGSSNLKILQVVWGKAGAGSVRLIQKNNESGYKDTLMINVQINAKPPKPVISEKNGSLTSSIPNGNQWFYNGIKIKDGLNQSYFTEERSGVYSVQISDTVGCLGDMSDPFNFVSSVEEITDGNSGIKVFPNPTSGTLNITINKETPEKVFIRIINILGSEVISSNFSSDEHSRIFDLRNLTDGVYILYIQIGKNQYQQRLILQK